MGISNTLLRLLARVLLLAVIAALVLILIEPLLIRYGLKRGLIYTARQNGSQLTIGEMHGSFLRGITLRDTRLESARSGVTSSIHLDKAEARFSWKSILWNRGQGFFKELTLTDVESTVTFTSRSTAGKIRNTSWLPAPARLELRHGSLSLQFGEQHTRLTDIDFQVDTAAPGLFTIGKLIIGPIPTPGQQADIAPRTFENLKGSTAFQGTKLILAEVEFAPNILLKTISTDLHNLNQGRVKVGFDFNAFEGSIRGELVNTPKDNRPQYEITGSFSQIAVGPLATFLQKDAEAGGIIDEGKFTFRGSPHALERATFTTRLEARDFKWGQRQWNSLILGASIVNRRIQIPELRLHQAHNLLKIKGELLLPEPGKAWWESDFSFDIAARIDELKELSDLIGSQLTDLTGKMTIDGNVRGQDKTFDGHLIVSGSNLTYRDTPFDLLNAGLKLEGNEVQIINVELARGRDFIRGKGVVSILGKTQFSGELKANIDELDTYRAVLAKPITPYPLQGGVVLDWSGDGTLEAHSGAFTAHFRQLHTSGTEETPATLPIDAELIGTYAPGRLSLTSCRLAHGEIKLETRLAAAGSTLTIDGLRLQKGGLPWLEASAKLPINLSQWWLAPSLSAIAFDQPLTVQLLANGVQLKEVAHLAGKALPISGLFSGSLQAEGTVRELSMNGTLALSKGQFPATHATPALENVEVQAELKGKQFQLTHSSATLAEGGQGGHIVAHGNLDLTRFFNPTLDLTLTGDKLLLQDKGAETDEKKGQSWQAKAKAALTLTGELGQATLAGKLELQQILQSPTPDFTSLLADNPAEPKEAAAPFSLPAPRLATLLPIATSPLAAQWRYDIALTTPATPKPGTLSADLRYSGSGPSLSPTGSLSYHDVAVGTAKNPAKIENATFFWSNSQTAKAAPLQPSHFTATVATNTSAQPLRRYLLGPINEPASTSLTPQDTKERPLLLQPADDTPGSPFTEAIDALDSTARLPLFQMSQ